MDRTKDVECRLAQALTQKEGAVQLLERVREALPSNALQRIFAELVETVQDGFNLEEESERTEKGLLTVEGEMRSFAKREVAGLLSSKVINLRKEVELQR